jgi:hypothetical protein
LPSGISVGVVLPLRRADLLKHLMDRREEGAVGILTVRPITFVRLYSK